MINKIALDGFGRMIRRRRESVGLTLADVAEATGIAVPNLSRIESDRTAVRSDTLERIAVALDARFALIPNGGVLTLADVRHRAEAGRRALARAGLSVSDPALRLAVRARAGVDTTAETDALQS